jgi:glycosyltransferase involved in cell wall biosynthesis
LSTGGGVNRVIRDLAELLSERLGARVNVVSARSNASPSYVFSQDVTVEYHGSRSLRSYLATLWRLRRSSANFVIGSWSQENMLLAGLLVGSRARLVLVEHTSWYFHGPLLRAIRRLAYRLAWRVLVLNPSEVNYYRRFLKNVRLLPNPVAIPSIEPSRQRERLIVAIGHLEQRKNFADAIRAFARSRLEEDGWSLAIIGCGEQQSELEKLIEELGLKAAAIHPPVGDLAPWYSRASLILVTSLLEVFSLVLAEAMAAGVVPIAYAADGPAYILEDFPDHLLPIGDLDALAAKVRAFADSREELRQALRMSIEDRFAPPVVAQQWSELLSG